MPVPTANPWRRSLRGMVRDTVTNNCYSTASRSFLISREPRPSSRDIQTVWVRNDARLAIAQATQLNLLPIRSVLPSRRRNRVRRCSADADQAEGHRKRLAAYEVPMVLITTYPMAVVTVMQPPIGAESFWRFSLGIEGGIESEGTLTSVAGQTNCFVVNCAPRCPVR